MIEPAKFAVFFGVVCGILIHTDAAAFGRTFILQTSAFAFLFVKVLGAAFLYPGIKAWRDQSMFRLQTYIDDDGQAFPIGSYLVDACK